MDNRYYKYGCPELMQDGRFLTNYMPKRTFDQIIRNVNNIEGSADYRIFLQSNTETIMAREREYLQQTRTCGVNGQCVNF